MPFTSLINVRIPDTRHTVIGLVMAAVLVVTGCGTQKNTAKTRWWHAFKARYNTYYNGTLAYIDGSLEKENGNKDNFTEIIPLYTVGNKTNRETGKANFERAIEKCQKTIKLHSIKRRPDAIYSCRLLNSRCSRLTAHMATMNPTVPKTRMGGKAVTGSSPAWARQE